MKEHSFEIEVYCVKYGVFISHRHEDWMLAGRVYDLLAHKGLRPFLDANSMEQGNFKTALMDIVQQCPYFLLILSKNTFRCMEPSDLLYQEIVAALDSDSDILLLGEEGFSFPNSMPKELESITNYHFYQYNRESFSNVIDKLCERDIKKEKLLDILDWRQSLKERLNCCLVSRTQMERKLVLLNSRFGNELVCCAQEGTSFEGENSVKFIHMACYAASIIFSPDKNMVDERAFDMGVMFNIFSQILKDPEASLEIVINAPGCAATQDAIDNEKLGNSALEEHPEAIFLSAYCNINKLIEDNPIFAKASREKRFRFLVTEKMLPYALFQVEYKDGWEEYNHMKVDLYSEGLLSNMERRSMMIFAKDDPSNYGFFVDRYKYIRDVSASRVLIQNNHDRWLQEWEQMKESVE